MKVHLFRVKCFTNLHVGSGDTNYNIIDNEVERDPVIGEPTIFSSGVKGALREHCENEFGENSDKVTHIFGSSNGGDRPGSYKFFGASLIARPLRVSSGKRSFLLASTPEIIKMHLDFLVSIGLPIIFDNDQIRGELEKLSADDLENGFVSSVDDVSKLEGKPVTNVQLDKTKALFAGEPFALTKDLSAYDLPVLAHNQLDNQGISKQLWYEEVVPHQSIFYFAVIAREADEYYDEFKKAITTKPVQFGGNASIGYGYTSIEEVLDE